MWIIAILLVVRLGQWDSGVPFASGFKALLWVLLVLLAAGLFFRPHEDIFGGQDTGAYLNGAATVARENALTYRDWLLSQVPVDQRDAFITQKQYPAKYHCLWLPAAPEAVMRPWFQAAYPVLAAVPAKLFGPRVVLFVIPLFALFAALAIRAIAVRLFDHRWAGEAAFLLYVLNPLVVWHARYSRPEIIASFFLLGGGALLLRAVSRPRWNAVGDVVLGSICISMAPFFHITASLVLLPLAIVLGIVMLAGRDDMVCAVPVGVIAFAGYIAQTLSLTDTYHLRPYFAPLAEHWIWLVSAAGCILAGLFVVSRWMAHGRRWQRFLTTCERALASRPAALFVGSMAIAAVAAVAWAAYHTDPEVVKHAPGRYIFRTDLRCAVGMISLPLAVLGGVGLFALAGLHRRRSIMRFGVLVSLLPAALLVGNMVDFFSTRYLLVAFLPLLALALCALVTLIPIEKRPGKIAFVVVVAAFCLTGLTGRWQMVRQSDYDGFVNYVAGISQDIRSQNGILLCEYMRIAAPFDLFYGIPTLPLNDERLNDYDAAERAWERIMRDNPDRPAFFVTPYARIPHSRYFAFELVARHAYTGSRLVGRRWSLPREVSPWGCTLYVYRMHLPDAGVPGRHRGSASDMVTFGDGNMGLRGLAAPRLFVDPVVRASRMGAGERRAMEAGAGDLWLVAWDGSSEEPPDISLANRGGGSVSLVWRHVTDGWWFGCAAVSETSVAPSDMTLVCGRPCVLGMTRWVHDDVSAPVRWRDDLGPEESVRVAGCRMTVRWALPDASWVMSAGGDEGWLLTCTLAAEEWGHTAHLALKGESASRAGDREVPTGLFTWELWRLGQGVRAGVLSLGMVSGPGEDGTQFVRGSMPVAMHAAILARASGE